MSHDQEDPSRREAMSAPPTAADFDQNFSMVGASAGLRRVWELAAPDLPPEVEPFSFVSPVAIDQATLRAALFDATATARFVAGDLTSTSLPDAHSDAAVSIDAFHFAADLAAAASEARRILRPAGRLVLTNWQPKVPDDARLPPRLRIDWPRLLRGAGFGDVGVEAQPEWHDLYTRVYRVAIDLGDPHDDSGLASLQDEARRRLPEAGLMRRVVVTATAPRLSQ
jgi:SAM-dependent methyltransferase